MVFSSLVFISVFFPIVYLLHLLIPSLKYKNYFLLLASLLFYAYGEVSYVLLLILCSLFNYISALLINRYQTLKKKILILNVCGNLLILAYFKYTAMILTSINCLFSTNLPIPQITLPIGISFFTFQAMSYVIDVYRNDVKVQKSYTKVLLYISFFPQLIAGPIIKYHDICSFIDNRRITIDQTAAGLRRFIIGLSKKVLIANVMGKTADAIFVSSSAELSILSTWIGALAYLLQIYYDFSGYSDMAIGLGRMFGFDIQENFQYPYCAESVKDFWKRWHISLSSWFREYLYIPLGGNRKGKRRTVLNKLFVFLCTGLWHGANWTFVVWGLYHGIFLFIEEYFSIKKLSKIIKHLYLILVVTVGFVIFRADNMSFALMYIRNMFFGFTISAESLCLFREQMTGLFFAAFIAGTIFACPVIPKLKNVYEKEQMRNKIWDSFSYLITFLMLLICMIRLSGNTYNPFIYFRF